MRQREWLDRQMSTHPWRTVLVLSGGLWATYITMRLIDFQASIDARALRRRSASVAATPS